ncbi:hypothetical protein XH98_36200 [Bradyrhizobium sp. CCBAU 51745]|nr:hypothetical protein [Bradyrhizobium sp. CCBAU 45384]MDA9444434.1 hypothetical protein [Bradyrhizobium sp. CCBAU 51745]
MANLLKAEIVKDELLELFLLTYNARKALASGVRERQKDVPGIIRVRLPAHEPLALELLRSLVMKPDTTLISFARALTGTPLPSSSSVRAIKIIICGPVMPSALAW